LSVFSFFLFDSALVANKAICFYSALKAVEKIATAVVTNLSFWRDFTQWC